MNIEKYNLLFRELEPLFSKIIKNTEIIISAVDEDKIFNKIRLIDPSYMIEYDRPENFDEFGIEINYTFIFECFISLFISLFEEEYITAEKWKLKILNEF
jgi:hypothetical protein